MYVSLLLLQVIFILPFCFRRYCLFRQSNVLFFFLCLCFFPVLVHFRVGKKSRNNIRAFLRRQFPTNFFNNFFFLSHNHKNVSQLLGQIWFGQQGLSNGICFRMLNQAVASVCMLWQFIYEFFLLIFARKIVWSLTLPDFEVSNKMA